MAYIEERRNDDGSTSYRVQIRVKGQKRISATFTRKTDAKIWAKETEVDLKNKKYFKTVEAKKHTLSELIDRYIRDVLPQKKDGIRSQRVQLLWWKEKIGYLLLIDVTSAVIVEMRDALASGTTPRGTKRSGATVNRYLAVLAHALNIAKKEWEWLEDNPMDKVSKFKESRGRVRFLNQEERLRLLEACKESQCPYLHAIVTLAVATGMRKNEIMHLKWEDVDLFRGRAVVQESKNGERRPVTLIGFALKVVKQLAKDRNNISPLLFPSTALSHKKPYDIRTAWENAVRRAGIKDFKFHDLRHDRASTLAQGGASLAQIAEVLGHKTLQMVKRYSHLTEGHVAGILEKLDRDVFGDNGKLSEDPSTLELEKKEKNEK